MNIYLPIHIDVDNRGCEAITKATTLLLNMPKEKVVALSKNILIDKKYNVDDYVTLIQRKNDINLWIRIKSNLLGFLSRDSYKAKKVLYSYFYDSFIEIAEKGDVVLSTGGDMLCYSDNEIIYINESLHKKGITTVLWGCSVGDSNLTPRKLETLNHFSLIYVRESLTKEVLEKHGIKNIVLYPDPAFILAPQTCELPICFSGNEVVGINLSNFVSSSCSLDSIYGRNITNLINYLLRQTPYHILLIPHVLWKGQDDRLISKLIAQYYDKESRISILNSEDYNYCRIRYIISKCEMFIGARTHSIISAYSMCVPSIALGYSIKSKGIAKDLGLSDNLVLDCVNLKDDNELLNSFLYLENNKIIIKEHLEKTIPRYKANRIDLYKYIKV